MNTEIALSSSTPVIDIGLSRGLAHHLYMIGKPEIKLLFNKALSPAGKLEFSFIVKDNLSPSELQELCDRLNELGFDVASPVSGT